MKALEPESFRPRFGIGLTAAIGLIVAVIAVVTLVQEGPGVLLSTWPWLALFAGGCWAIFYNPQVAVDGTGVRLVNVWHTIEVPWQALIGLDTKWALTLVTAERRYRAWAAPAPGRSAMRGDHPDTHRLREAAVGGEIRPGDMPNTDSGEAAALVRKHWRVHLETLPTEPDDGDAEPASVGQSTAAGMVGSTADDAFPAKARRTIHVSHLVAAGALVALGVVGII